MHTLQPKHSKLSSEEAKKLLLQYNISLSQLPKISRKDPALSEEFKVGDIIKIERKTEEGTQDYFRVVV
jgi:DNA-directed RNA polymerase subunit H